MRLFNGSASVSMPNKKSSVKHTRESAIYLSPPERGGYVERIRVKHLDYNLLLSKIEALISDAKYLNNSGGFRLLGPPGVGKSLILSVIKDKHPEIESVERKVCPVLCVQTGTEINANQIAENMLEALSYPFSKVTRQKDKIDILIDAINTCSVDLIAFDEFQHCAEGDRDKRGYAIADLMKIIHDQVRSAFLFVGTAKADKIFELNDQLRSRLPGREMLTHFACDETFQGILQAFDQELPMYSPAGLGQPELAEPIYQATQGSMRSLKLLLTRAVILAAQENAIRVTTVHLETAYDFVFGRACLTRNPFRK